MGNYDPTDVAQKIMEAIQKEYKELTKLNVMVLGKTGVGKSTLINNMFSEKLADTGVGQAVTRNIKKIEKPDFPLAIYDTPGMELDGDNNIDQITKEITDLIKEKARTGEMKEAIHCIWYCIATPSSRIEAAEINFIKNISTELDNYSVPIIVVLTKSYSKNDTIAMKTAVEKENLPVKGVVPVLAEDYELDEDTIVKAKGLDKLSALMNNIIPETVQKTFIAVQCANLELKKGKANAVVAAAATAAAATGAVPIPFSDAAVLVPEQIAMLAGITSVFGVSMDKASIASIVSATIGTAGTTVLGKTVVSGLLKIIPGVGSVAGGAISAATAAALTTALGEAYISIMCMIAKGDMKLSDLSSDAGRKKLSDIFRSNLKVKRDSKGQALK